MCRFLCFFILEKMFVIWLGFLLDECINKRLFNIYCMINGWMINYFMEFEDVIEIRFN